MYIILACKAHSCHLGICRCTLFLYVFSTAMHERKGFHIYTVQPLKIYFLESVGDLLISIKLNKYPLLIYIGRKNDGRTDGRDEDKQTGRQTVTIFLQVHRNVTCSHIKESVIIHMYTGSPHRTINIINKEKYKPELEVY